MSLFIFFIFHFNRAVCLFEQKSSDITDSSDMDRGFTSAVMLPFDQGLLCVTADQQFLFYSPVEHPEEMFKLILSRRLVGYNEEIVDMKFLGEEEQFLAVATNLEQVNRLILTYLNIFCTGSLHPEDVRSEYSVTEKFNMIIRSYHCFFFHLFLVSVFAREL